jgi:hypothetical protein
MIQYGAASPVGQGAAAVLGALDNAVVGGEAAVKGGNVGDIARGAWEGLSQPGQASRNVHRLEKNIGLSQPGLTATGEEDPHANLGQRALQVVEDTGLQSQTAFIPGWDVFGLLGKAIHDAGMAGHLLSGAEHAVEDVEHAGAGVKGATSAAVKGAAGVDTKASRLGPIGKAYSDYAAKVSEAGHAVGAYFDADHELNRLVTPKGRNIIKGDQADRTYVHKQLDAAEGDEHILATTETEQARKALKDAADPEQIAKDFVANHPKELRPGKTEQDLKKHLIGVAATKLTEQMSRKVEPKIMENISRVGRDAVFLMPFAHWKNITILTVLGPRGLQTLAKGASYIPKIMSKDPEMIAKIEHLDRLGISTDYHNGIDKIENSVRQNFFAQHLPGPLGKAAGFMAEKSAGGLTTYDRAMRVALYEHFKSKAGGMLSDTDAAGEIRTILGDYGNPSAFTKLLSKMGGSFPVWRMNIVPKAMAKAIREQPGTAEMWSHVAQNLNNDVMAPTLPGQRNSKTGAVETTTAFDLGGPLDEFANLILAPQKVTESSSTMGPLGEIPKLDAAIKQGKIADFVKMEAEKYVPMGSIISKIPQFNPWASRENHPLTSTALGLIGAYTTDLDKLNKRKGELVARGLKGKDLFAELSSEGYILPSNPPSTGQ